MPEAEKFYLQSLEIYTRLAQQNPAQFEPDLALTLNNLGVFYEDTKQLEKARAFYSRALALRQKALLEGKIYQKGEFTFPIAVSPLYGYDNFVTFIKGTTYFQNGLTLYSDYYSYGLYPSKCAILNYPNGDYISSCDFNWENANLSGTGEYHWANGSYYKGAFSNGIITKKGTFFDGKGNSAYGDFPKYSKAKNGDDLLFGIATVGLVAWGLSELFPSSQNKTTSTKTDYAGSYSAHSNTSSYSSSSNSSSSSSSSVNKPYEIPKCYKCSGRGVCLQCNGRGSSLCSKCDGKGVIGGIDIFMTSYKDPCTKCEGTGIKKCEECSGKGTCYKCKGKGTSY